MNTDTEQAESTAQIVAFPRVCREAGLKVTPQRVAVYAMLASVESHPSPEDVYAAIRRELPSVSLATIYKILDLFHAHGFIRRVSTERQVARYDARLEVHHHLICSKCGRIQDVLLPEGASAGMHLPDSVDFHPSAYELLFHGLCGDCAGGVPGDS